MSEQQDVSAQERNDRRSQRTSRRVRLGVLAGVLVAITAIGIGHQNGIAKVVGVDALCPFGGIESLYSLLANGTLIQRVSVSSVILLIGVVLTALLFRRAFCGYVCPLGAIQEFVGMIGRKLFGRQRPVVPPAIDRFARYLKYAALVFFAVWSWQAAELVIRPYDPWVAWMHLTSTELFAEFGIGAAILGISLVGSLVYERFFCKYLCPMGAFLGVMSPASVFKIRRDETACTSCGSCDKACPVNLKVSTAETVNSPECINCNECVNVCPAKGALQVAAPGEAKTRKILQPTAMLGLTAVVLAGVVGATTASGNFRWTMPGLAAASEAGHEAEAAREAGHEAEAGAETAGGTSAAPASSQSAPALNTSVNVDDIRGSMSFAELQKATNIPEERFLERFRVTSADMDKPMKELAESHGFDVHTDVREWVAEQLGK